MFYTYLIYSKSHRIFYKGFTTDVIKRVEQHIHSKTKYTRIANDWKLVFVKSHPSKKEALEHERLLKRQNQRYLHWRIEQEDNIVLTFIR
jgi:putative endonuclease